MNVAPSTIDIHTLEHSFIDLQSLLFNLNSKSMIQYNDSVFPKLQLTNGEESTFLYTTKGDNFKGDAHGRGGVAHELRGDVHE
jgi:hypothetical protein